MHLAFHSHSTAAHAGRLMVAGLAVAGAGLFALTAPIAGPLVQHHDVKLVSGEVDWTTFLSNAEANLAALQTEGTTSSTELSTALGNISSNISGEFSTALSGFETGIQNSLDGGWYGGDDGYVFGLFGGTVTDPTTGVSETGSTLGEISTALQDGNTLQAYSDFNAWSLETLDHSLKPLLAPLLDETTKGVTTYSIPAELSQIQTNLINTFGTYNELKELAQTVLSPEISGAFAFSGDIQNISTELAAGDTTLATSDLENLGSDVINAIVNGYDAGTNPYNGAAELFPGLINSGSFLDELYTTWTEQFVTALGTLATESATAGASEAVGSSVPDFLTGLLSF